MRRPIAIVVVSGTRERLQLAGMTAAVAAVSGAPVRVFVSMNALACFDLRGARVPCEGDIGAALETRGPPFEQLFAEAVELGDAEIFPCSQAMELAGMTTAMLPGYFGSPLGMTRFLEEAADAQVWTF